jgi:hypothetical protein
MQIGFGRSTPFWSAVVALQGHRLATYVEAWPALLSQPFATGRKQLADWQIHAAADSHLLFIASRHVLRFARRLDKEISSEGHDDASLLLKDFHSGESGRAQTIRDLLEHWDDYTVGGDADRKKGILVDNKNWSIEVEDVELVFSLGTNKIGLMRLCSDVYELSEKIDALAWDAITPPGSPLRQDDAKRT